MPLLAVLVTFGALLGARPQTLPAPSGPEKSQNPLSEETKGVLTFSSGLDQTEYWQNQNGYSGSFYVEVKATDKLPGSANTDRLPLNLCIVVDRSGSMGGDKIENAKKAAQFAVDQLGKGDRVSVFTYSNGYEMVGAATSPAERSELNRKISMISASGGTNLSGGMEAGFAWVKQNYLKNGVNRVLLMSDGHANAGVVDVKELARMVKNHNLQEGISLSTFGLGLNYNEILMNEMADAGSGNYYFIQHPGTIADIFNKEMHGLNQVVARNTELRIDLPNGMEVTKVSGFPFTQQGQTLKVAFKDFSAGQTKSVLVGFRITDPKDLFTVKSQLDYEEGAEGQSEGLSMTHQHLLKRTEDPAKAEASISPEVKSQAVLFQANENLEEAMRAVDAGDFEKARELTAANESYLESNAGFIPYNTDLQRQMTNNSAYQVQLNGVEQLNASDIQVMQKGTRATNYMVRSKK